MPYTVMILVWLASLLTTVHPPRRTVGPRCAGPGPPAVDPGEPDGRNASNQAPCYGYGQLGLEAHAPRACRGWVAIVR